MPPIEIGNIRGGTPDPSGLPGLPEELPILPMRSGVVFPFGAMPIAVGQERSVRLVDDVSRGDRVLGAVTVREPAAEEPTAEQLFSVGTAGIIHRLQRTPDGTIHLLLQGLERIRIERYTAADPYLKARVVVVPETVPPSDDLEAQALKRNLVDLLGRLSALIAHIPEEMIQALREMEDLRMFAYAISSSVRMEQSEAQSLLEEDSIVEKMRHLVVILNRELELLEMGKKIQDEAKSEMSKGQREFYLRQQLEAIRRELGEGDEHQDRVEEIGNRITAAGMPEEAEKEARRELNRLNKLPPGAPEYGSIETYLDWMTEMPWSIATEDNLDIERAREILDRDHCGLEKIKEIILQYLAVRKLTTERRSSDPEPAGPERGPNPESADGAAKGGAILCFVGPPGVGKTSLGRSIARALGRKFARLSLGGVRDEAEIRGHRRTYIGALPGRIVQTIRRVGSRNPVLMFDEIDKVGADWRGDPSSALLEVLDPEQNRDFRDHYLGVAVDLSDIIFITTANVVDTISGPLLDRMEVIELAGYTDEEKCRIAQGYLVPRQRRENGLRLREISFSDDALMRIIRDYTREAGVRNLERRIGTACRKAATRIAEGKAKKLKVGSRNLTDYLGKPRYYRETKERTAIPGIATGLAMTAVGGEILFVEATKMPGGKGLIITGQLGDVMKESAQAAVSYTRSQLEQLGADRKFFQKFDIHIHVPAGAVPKDGPSAGVTMATALASLLTGRLVRGDVGMTGEITLRGQVLPVGGIKEKVLAAHRAGLTTVILPRRNENDLDELPERVKAAINFQLADRVEQVLATALEPIGPIASAAGRPRKSNRRKKKIDRPLLRGRSIEFPDQRVFTVILCGVASFSLGRFTLRTPLVSSA